LAGRPFGGTQPWSIPGHYREVLGPGRRLPKEPIEPGTRVKLVVSHLPSGSSVGPVGYPQGSPSIRTRLIMAPATSKGISRQSSLFRNTATPQQEFQPSGILTDAVRALSDRLGTAAVLHRFEDTLVYEYDYGLDRHAPEIVVFPTSTEQVAE